MSNKKCNKYKQPFLNMTTTYQADYIDFPTKIQTESQRPKSENAQIDLETLVRFKRDVYVPSELFYPVKEVPLMCMKKESTGKLTSLDLVQAQNAMTKLFVKQKMTDLFPEGTLTGIEGPRNILCHDEKLFGQCQKSGQTIREEMAKELDDEKLKEMEESIPCRLRQHQFESKPPGYTGYINKFPVGYNIQKNEPAICKTGQA